MKELSDLRQGLYALLEEANHTHIDIIAIKKIINALYREFYNK